MKKVKKIIALMLAAVMMLAMGVTALALENGSGSITIENATIGKSYNIYKIFDTDSTGAGNITATETQKAFYEGIKEETDSTDPSVIIRYGNPFSFTKNDLGTYNVSVAKGKSDEYVIAFLQQFVTQGTDGAISLDANFAAVVNAGNAEEAKSATVTFNNIPYGYYLVTSTLGAVVTVDSTSVTVIDKNQTGPDWNENSKVIITGTNVDDGTDITAREVSANFGDTIDYKIEFTATNYDGEDAIEYYTITDTLAKGMSYVLKENSNNLDITVTVKEANNTQAASVEATVTPTENTDGNPTFALTIDWQEKTDEAYNGNFKYESPSTITVTYSAKVDTDADIAGDGNANTAALSYHADDGTENGKTTTEDTTSKTIVYTYALGFHKIDGANKTKNLSGAEFTVQLKSENPDFGVNDDSSLKYIYATIGAVQNEDGTYSYTADNTATEYKTTFISDNDGLIVIKGVAAGTYTVTETKAPAGYNLLPEAVDVEAVMDSETTYTSTTTTHYDKDGNVVKTETQDGTTVTATYEVPVAELIIENNAGTELPSTGGMGTTIFYILGGILVLGAAVLLVTRRRMRNME